MTNYQNWLDTYTGVRVILVHANALVGNTESALFLLTHPIKIGTQVHTPVIKNTINILELLSIDYQASISYGDIELANNNGILDTWLNSIWKNRSIKIYCGGLPNPTDAVTLSGNFELIFDGVAESLDLSDRNTLNIKIRDKLEKINTPVTEEILGTKYYHGSTLTDPQYTNQNGTNIKPIIYGEVHNISPLLADPTLLEYMVCLLDIEQIIEVLDNGVPVNYTTVDGSIPIPLGSFRLISPPQGTCTTLVQGIKRTVNTSTGSTTNTYNPSILNTILNLLLFNSKSDPGNPLQIDTSSFNSLGQEKCGLYLNSKTNVLSICQELAKSAGLTLTITRLGKVKLVELLIPSLYSTTINENETILNSLRIVNTIPVVGAVKLGYAKNYTVLTGLLTGIPEAHKDLYSKEFLESSQSDNVVITKNDLSTETTLKNTYLINKVDADAVALKELNLFKSQRRVLGMTCISKFLSVEIGQAVRVIASRFGLDSGVIGIVTNTKPDWVKGTIYLEVLV